MVGNWPRESPKGFIEPIATQKEDGGRCRGTPAAVLVQRWALPPTARPRLEPVTATRHHNAARFIRAIGEEAHRVTREALTDRSTQALDAVLAMLAADVDANLDAIRTDYPLRVDCRAGCDACCHLRVYVSPMEAFALARAVRAAGDRVRRRVQRRARKTARRVETLDPNAHSRARVPCPLLENGRCLAYQARPIPCRSLWSASAAACESGPETPVPRHGVAVLYGMGTQAGAALGAAALELDAAPVELAAALSVALEDDASEARWLRGEPLFEVARARDTFGLSKRLPVLG